MIHKRLTIAYGTIVPNHGTIGQFMVALDLLSIPIKVPADIR